jgi:chromosome segregation ATPase
MTTIHAVPEPRTAAAVAARRGQSQAALKRVAEAIARLRREKTPVSVAAVARRAGVSRTFCYENTEARAAITAARVDVERRHGHALAAQDDEQDAAWRERARNAEAALKTTNTEILTQRARIGELLGRIRDLEAEWSSETIQKVTTENTNLKQRVRELSSTNRTLEERLSAARSNLRFQDRHIADLETRLADADTADQP